MKHNNIRFIGIPEGEEKEQWIEILFHKIMTENFLTLERGKNHTCSGSTEGPNQVKIPSFKDKNRISKAARGQQEVTCNGALIRLAVDFSTDTLQARKE